MDASYVESLRDSSALKFDNTLSPEERLAYVLDQLKTPLCFRFGQMGIQLEFDDQGPPLQEMLIHLLIRRKNGL